MAPVALAVSKWGRRLLSLALAVAVGVVVAGDPSQARRRAQPAKPAPSGQSQSPDVPPASDARPQPAQDPHVLDATVRTIETAAGTTADAPPGAVPAPTPRPVAAFAATSQDSLRDGSPFEPGPALALPPAPQDPRGAKAYAVLSSYCASCHQRTATQGAAPAADFGNVLDLAALARDPWLVQPGNPDGSRLYQMLYSRHVPSGLASSSGGGGPTVIEVEALRDWIESLPPPVKACPDRQRIDAAELDAIMRRWLEAAGPDAARSTRFVSLAHLHNACASDAELAAYRQAVQKLLNSLSWSSEPTRIETVGDALVILAFRLSDLGWVPAHWERLAAAEPEGGAVPMPEALKSHSASQHPVIRGDWLASVAARAPLYYELLGLPDKQSDLARLIGIDLDSQRGAGRLLRAGLKASSETKAPRLVERRGPPDGHGVWLAHDWPSSTDGADVIDSPLAPHAATPGKKLPPPALQRMLLTLPNGLAAFVLHDAKGGITSDDGRRAAGAQCMSCHITGPRAFVDEVRPHLTSDRPALPRDAQEAAFAVYPGAGELARQFEDDGYQYRRALIQAGVDPDLTLDGLEIVSALAHAYDRDVGSRRLAAETGLAADEVLRRLDALTGDLAALGQRVRQATVSRIDAERLLAQLRIAPQAVALAGAHGSETSAAHDAGSHHDAAAQGIATASLPAKAAGRMRISLWSDRVSYASGDLITLSAETTRDCYLTLVEVDTNGKGTVLFPNEFEPDNLIKAGTRLRVPGDKAPYQLRLKDKGRETTVAICNTARKLPFGVNVDYERQRFTTLGSWRNFLNDAQPLEAAYRANPDKARAAAAARAHAAALALAKGRAAADDAAAAARAMPEPASPGEEAETRTAVQFRIN